LNSWLTGRHSHRDLLKTAHNVLDMRQVLDSVELQHNNLMTYSPQVVSIRALNAERYHKQLIGRILHLNVLIYRVE